MSLQPHHATHLAKFRISTELFGVDGRYEGDTLDGILFAYLSPVGGRRTGGRVRLDKPIGDMKYLMEQGCRHLYWGSRTSAPYRSARDRR